MKVMIDACVLYPTVMREMVLGCARAGLFAAHWSPRVLEEWARAAARLGPQQALFARGEIAALAVDFPSASLRDDPARARQLWLPDKDDVHVLAAAITGRCAAILTLNSRDFPRDILAEHDLLRLEPDGYLCDLYRAAPDQVGAVAAQVLAQAQAMSGQDWTARALMKKARLPRLGKALAAQGAV